MLCILGPTASGKSALALTLAHQRGDIEIISMDSALVYRGMDIGTAKPTLSEQAEVRHHLIDLIDPTESYSAARFVKDAEQAAIDIRSRGKIPLLVGGTMLYYKALREGLDDLPSAPIEIRDAIAKEAHERGWPALHETLSAIDIETASRLKPNDAQRISRALELYQLTGKSMSQLIRESGERSVSPLADQLTTIALMPEDRALLHERIAVRFHQMVASGFLDEMRKLMEDSRLHPELPSMRCVGYRQAWDHLKGETNFETFVEAGIAATRQLAKRQITWLRSFPHVVIHDPFSSDPTTIQQMCLAALDQTS
jgi:tRNA dimethylallyltransferase